MSLSAHDIFRIINGLEESESESLPASGGSEAETQVDENILFLSSLGSSFTLDDSISLNSSALLMTDGNAASRCMITLPPDIVAGMENIRQQQQQQQQQQRHDDGNDDDDRGGECTIIPSIESGTLSSACIPAPPPEASQDIFILSPHPRMTTDHGIQSISTTDTESVSYEYIQLNELRRRNYNNEESSYATSTALASMNIRNDVVSSTTTINQMCAEGLGTDAFERVAGHLMAVDSSLLSSSSFGHHHHHPTSSSSTTTTTTNYNNYWYNQLISESDWDGFYGSAKNFLSILQSEEDDDHSSLVAPPSQHLPPLPPILPDAALMIPSSDIDESTSVVPPSPSSYLPSEFICSICKDVLVGACTLNCNGNCNSSTVCASCWDEHNYNDDDDDDQQQELATLMDFVWVETETKTKTKKCPSCHTYDVINVYYCHALDVAILHIIRGLPETDNNNNNNNNNNLTHLKRRYYSRLLTWRNIVHNRNERYRQQKSIRDDELLARLIQEEERVFWKERSARQRRQQGGGDREHQQRINNNSSSRKVSNRIIFLGHAAVAIIATALASTGLKAMTRR
jgi:hypothetical protein